jgi:hypothetical protein
VQRIGIFLRIGMIVDAGSLPFATSTHPENDGSRLEGKALVTLTVFLSSFISLNEVIRSAKCRNQQ